MEAILGFVPPEDVVKFSAMTGQSLYYMGDDSLKHKILQPPGGVFIAADIKIGVANHVRQQERFHFLAGAVILHLFCQVPAGPQCIVGMPLPGE